MQVVEPSKIWWTAQEIADANMQDMPQTRQGVEKVVKTQDWRSDPTFAQKRKGRGGGWEYSWQLFSERAKQAMLAASAIEEPQKAKETPSRDELALWYDSLPKHVKVKAEGRVVALQAVAQQEAAGLTRFLAVDAVARIHKVSDRTIWNWISLVENQIEHVPLCDYKYYLAPRHKAANRNDPNTACDPEFIDRLKADYLRLEAPTFTSAYRRVVRLCQQNKWTILPERTARRRLNQMVPRVSQIFARQGLTGLQKCFPPQVRDRSGMVAMEGVNADCHKIDVFVKWPDGTVNRPQIVVFQDLFSNKMLSWRVDHTPNKVAVMSAFGDMIEDYGIPKHCLFDNGSEFANKWLTGGTKTRFRYKIREDDPLGVLPSLGIQIHWATPAHGQAKPIERGFRDWAEDIAKDPRFAGAYVGNSPHAKPENYQSREIPIETFLHILDEGIQDHNARVGRRTDNAKGRSFDETFNASYAIAPIAKPTEEQRRLWLMGQEVKTTQQGHGRIKLHGNMYWSDWMSEYAGQKVVTRFDPEDLHIGVYIYELNGSFLGFAACQEKSGFFSLEDAQETARQKSKYKRMHKKLLAQVRPMGVDALAAEMNAMPQEKTPLVAAKVVSAPFGKGNRGVVKAPEYTDRQTPDDIKRHEAFVAQFPTQQIKDNREEETQREMFVRALALEEQLESGAGIGAAEADWLRSYQDTPGYRGERMVHDDFKGRSTS
jgi:transposase InsO family protein